MRRSLSLVAAGLTLTLALTGCGGDEKKDAAPPSSGQSSAASPDSGSSATSAPAPTPVQPSGATDPAGWVNDYCGALSGLKAIENAGQDSGGMDPADPDAGRKSISALYGKIYDALNGAVGSLGKLAKAPDPVGDTAKQKLIDAYKPAAEKVKAAKTKLDAAAPGDQQALTDAMAGLQTAAEITDSIVDPLKDLQASPALAAAIEKAPNCKNISG
ncbi:hypothetical protein SAMN05421504_102399 [Amycolatopsis xylanica]|uniref:Small secreted protein n=1 Tax=Amycolatopsis xylanica TaxID=589385 RepID=A0A1H2Z6V0_9PSEU|nr:hypothetical protein [Amycolatopsis xylanica]SDX13081.1 hypothetical protein SAMN05421504_102399 [Amycolatopsis xylanica]